jgi:GrpB-like predicted nucleotidyltransferase (UPF0157 family)
MKVIRPHDPRWQEYYASEAQALWKCLDETVLEIHHIGNTAIPGRVAMPVIDILLETRALDAIDERAPALEKIG